MDRTIRSVMSAHPTALGPEATLGTAVTCPSGRIHPAIIAQAAATTAALMPGRFVLGVGTGENLNEHILGQGWPETEVRQARLTVAERLRNTPAICRKSYIHPAILSACMEATPGLEPARAARSEQRMPLRLSPEERGVLRYLAKATTPSRPQLSRRRSGNLKVARRAPR